MNKQEFSNLEIMARSPDPEAAYVASTILRQDRSDKSMKLLSTIPMENRIKDYSDLCQELGVKELTIKDFSMFSEHERLKLFSCHRIGNIGRFINGKWIPNWDDSGERKWFPIFVRKNGVWAFYRSHYIYSSDGQVGFYQTREKSDFAGKFFPSVYGDWLQSQRSRI